MYINNITCCKFSLINYEFKKYMCVMNFILIIVSTMEVSAVLGKSASLPCDIEPATRGDGVYMVLWFRGNSSKPIYR